MRKKRKKKLTINRLLHKWLPETHTVNLNEIFFLNEVIQLLVWYFSIYKGVSWNMDSKHFKTLETKNRTLLKHILCVRKEIA